ncbi:MAG TPA: histidine phosphatase family protein [Saprospiraceae bacterium]|nr:histidine phosphatase family protein [Saprospiraceae bacterium]
MKTLLFVRHAKSSWDDPELSDFERPLNGRGLKDAPFMAALLSGKMDKPDKIVSSPATRAITTAKFFAKAFKIEEKEILTDRNIYEASTSALLNVIRWLDEDWKTVLIFGHNPAFTDVVNQLSPKTSIFNIPTCGICEITTTADTWLKISSYNSSLKNHYFPKEFH